MNYFKFLNDFNKKYPNEILLILLVNILATCNIFLFNNNIINQLLTTIFIVIIYFLFSSYSINKKKSIFITYYIFAFTLLLVENIIIQVSNKNALSYNSSSLENLSIGPFKIHVPFWLLSAYFSMTIIIITIYNIIEQK